MHDLDRAKFETDRMVAGVGSAEERDFLEVLGDLLEAETRATAVGHGASAPRIQDQTRLTPTSLRRRRPARPGKVWALVLHQMAFSRGNDPARYNRVNSHFAILPDGAILQLHPVAALLAASNGFNSGSVAVEFAGNLPNVRGKCWSPTTHRCHRLTSAQIWSGRHMVDHLIRTIGLTHVLAHRQSSATRENDPGPDVWYHVGQWAIERRGMKDGGPGFKVGNGRPILDAWRTWGKPGQPGARGLSFETPGQNMDREALDELRGCGAMDDPRYGAHTMEELVAAGAGARARLAGPEPAC